MMIWNHPTGVARFKGADSFVTFGLTGSGDLIGIRAVRITPEMVGTILGQGIAVDVKAPGDHQRPNQKNFEKRWTELGGVYVLARSVDDVKKL
jgi:hypothetical protein